MEQPRKSDSGSSPTPTLWIGLAVVLGIAVIGLAIWGFGQKSDLDDANKKISKVENQAGTTERGQKAANEAEKGFGEKEVRRYRKVRGELISADKQEANFKNEVTQDANALQQAKSELATAKTDEERTAAQSKVSKASSKAATTCVQATVDAIGAFDTQGAGANNPSSAAETAMNKLEAVSGQCMSALKGS